jgi:hypothetical protein
LAGANDGAITSHAIPIAVSGQYSGVYVLPNKSSIVGHDRLLSPCGPAFLVSQLEA